MVYYIYSRESVIHIHIYHKLLYLSPSSLKMRRTDARLCIYAIIAVSIANLLVADASACESMKSSQEKCLSSYDNGVPCAYCLSAAVGTLCAPETETKDLPTSVFKCTYQTSANFNETKKVSAEGVYGIDVSSVVSVSSFQCLSGVGITSVVVRAYRSSGSIDSNACTTLNNANAAGFRYRDAYIFPCPTCGTTPASQINDMVQYLQSTCPSAWSGRLWLDIEGSQYWTGNYANNQV